MVLTRGEHSGKTEGDGRSGRHQCEASYGTLLLRGVLLYTLTLVMALPVWTACGAGAGVMPAALSEVTVTDQDDRDKITLASGQTLVVRLKASLGTGFSWQVVANDARILEQARPPMIEPPERTEPGAVERQVFRFTAQTRGSAVLELHYFRPWEKGVEPARKYRVTVTVR
jgi:inhibitor of cysteine peptidase